MIAQIITGLSSGAAYALVAIGVVLVYKSTRALSIAQGEIGAFGFLLGLRWADRGVPWFGWHLPRFGTLVVAMVVGGLIGLLVERFVMRPLVQRPPLDGLIATLGVALVLALAELQIFGTAQQNAPPAVGEWRVRVLGATLVSSRVVAVVVTVLVAGALYVFFSRTKFGLAVLATTSDPIVARVLGVPVNQVYRFAWVAGCALAGVAAALLGPAFGGIAPFDLTRFTLRALAGAVLGGLDSIWGAIAGSLIIGVVEAVVGTQVAAGGADTVAVLVLVLVTLLVRPRGLFGATAAA
ncbi:MAG: branched-chain amino acid ABC transporter permease [Actinobacteria bacterium]|nr:branched-chain amino acid ABC transporter permease [Actinomycetota bacterium]